MKAEMQSSIGIDWVSTAMVMGAFLIGQIHAISARVRFAVMDDIVLAVAGVAGLYYLVKALRYRPPPSAAE